MALKDLIVDSGKVTEAALEEIISGYVKYELNPCAIVFTPEGSALGNMEKVIVYCASILGWRYAVDDPPSVSTKPADLEDILGIPGGTLRPLLKRLKDNHILAVSEGHYSIRPSNLAAAGRIVSGKKNLATFPSKSKVVKAAKSNVRSDAVLSGNTKSKKKAGMPIKASLESLLGEGFFSEFRTLAQILERLHELAVNAKITSLSGPAADLVRHKKLERKKVKENGKQIWAYRASQS